MHSLETKRTGKLLTRNEIQTRFFEADAMMLVMSNKYVSLQLNRRIRNTVEINAKTQ